MKGLALWQTVAALHVSRISSSVALDFASGMRSRIDLLNRLGICSATPRNPRRMLRLTDVNIGCRWLQIPSLRMVDLPLLLSPTNATVLLGTARKLMSSLTGVHDYMRTRHCEFDPGSKEHEVEGPLRSNTDGFVISNCGSRLASARIDGRRWEDHATVSSEIIISLQQVMKTTKLPMEFLAVDDLLGLQGKSSPAGPASQILIGFSS